MSDDGLIGRLREGAGYEKTDPMGVEQTMADAANEIKRLNAELKYWQEWVDRLLNENAKLQAERDELFFNNGDVANENWTLRTTLQEIARMATNSMGWNQSQEAKAEIERIKTEIEDEFRRQ